MCQKTTQEELEIFAVEIANIIKTQFNLRDLILLTIISLIAISLLVLSYKQGYSDGKMSCFEKDIEYLKHQPYKELLKEQRTLGIDISTFEVDRINNTHNLHYVYYKKLNSDKSEYYTVISKKNKNTL